MTYWVPLVTPVSILLMDFPSGNRFWSGQIPFRPGSKPGIRLIVYVLTRVSNSSYRTNRIIIRFWRVRKRLFTIFPEPDNRTIRFYKPVRPNHTLCVKITVPIAECVHSLLQPGIFTVIPIFSTLWYRLRISSIIKCQRVNWKQQVNFCMYFWVMLHTLFTVLYEDIRYP